MSALRQFPDSILLWHAIPTRAIACGDGSCLVSEKDATRSVSSLRDRSQRTGAIKPPVDLFRLVATQFPRRRAPIWHAIWPDERVHLHIAVFHQCYPHFSPFLAG